MDDKRFNLLLCNTFCNKKGVIGESKAIQYI